MAFSPLKSSELARALALLESNDWRAAHAIVQRDENSEFSCWAHGIVHLMEGDTSNARYWYGQAKRQFSPGLSPANEIIALKEALSRQRPA